MCANFSNLLYYCAYRIGDIVRADKIYKILRQTEWGELKETGKFLGSAVDLQDGFIHLSTSAQLQGTLDKHYTQGDDIVLAEVQSVGLGDKLKYEVSRGGAKFPHLYGILKIENVSRHWLLKPDPHGRYVVDELLGDDT